MFLIILIISLFTAEALKPRSITNSRKRFPLRTQSGVSEAKWLDIFALSPMSSPTKKTSDVKMDHNLDTTINKSLEKKSNTELITNDQSNNNHDNNIKIKSIQASTWVRPSIGAWRVVGLNDDNDAPPTIRSYLYGTVGLQGFHKERVDELWESIRKRGSLKDFSEDDKNTVKDALATAYVALYGMTTKRSHEACIDRARGTAAVLGELRADVNVVVTGILHEVFPIVYGLDNSFEAAKNIGNLESDHDISNNNNKNHHENNVDANNNESVGEDVSNDDTNHNKLQELLAAQKLQNKKVMNDNDKNIVAPPVRGVGAGGVGRGGAHPTSNLTPLRKFTTDPRSAWKSIEGIQTNNEVNKEIEAASSTASSASSSTTSSKSGSSLKGWDDDQWLFKPVPSSELEQSHFESPQLTLENNDNEIEEQSEGQLDDDNQFEEILDFEEKVEVDEMAVLREAMENRFGKDVMELGHAYCKLPRFMSRRAVYSLMQSENHIQMLVATADDYRALYMRLGERLHTMRVLRSLPLEPEDVKKIAQEALHVYAPLAHKMGVMKVKGELEDLAFRVLDPEMFKRTRYTQIAANKAFHDAAEAVQDVVSNDEYLRSHGASYRLTYRIKDKYQLSLKMKNKGLDNPNDVRDALGLRIILEHPLKKDESPEEHTERGRKLTYYVISLLRDLPGWSASTNSQGFKDYILNKKENGYESLHQYIKHSTLGTSVEIQVRTMQMHLNAELGAAAHWYYKDLSYRKEVAHSKIYKTAWRSEAQCSGKCRSPAEMIGYAKQQLMKERVFVFLEDRSTVLNLRRGSTSLDAAFAIHTELGLSAQTVTVRGTKSTTGEDSGHFHNHHSHHRVGLNTPLRTADVIAVKSTKDGSPTAKHSWFGMVRSPQSQIALRRHFREQARSSTVALGLARLLMGLSLNRDVPAFRAAYGGAFSTTKNNHDDDEISNKNTLSASILNQYARSRCGCKSIAEWLFLLGTSTRQDGKHHLARLLGIPSKDLAVCPPSFVTNWARLQDEAGWRLQNDLITESEAASGESNDNIIPVVPTGTLNLDITGATTNSAGKLNLGPILQGLLKELNALDGLDDIEDSWNNLIRKDSSPSDTWHETPSSPSLKVTLSNAATVTVASTATPKQSTLSDANAYMSQNAGRFKKKSTQAVDGQ